MASCATAGPIAEPAEPTEPAATSAAPSPSAAPDVAPRSAEGGSGTSARGDDVKERPVDAGGASEGTAAAAGASAAPTRCTDRPEQEAPVHEGSMGQGDRLIRISNRTGVPVRLRLLGERDEPALAGTLHVPKAGQVELHVAAGTYRVRYRLESSCEVLRGSPISLTGNRAGVEIQLRSGGSGSGSVQRVGEAL